MTTHHFKPLWLLAAASALAVASAAAVAQSSAASSCPGFSISPTNVVDRVELREIPIVE